MNIRNFLHTVFFTVVPACTLAHTTELGTHVESPTIKATPQQSKKNKKAYRSSKQPIVPPQENAPGGARPKDTSSSGRTTIEHQQDFEKPPTGKQPPAENGSTTPKK
jgi:hypothetical protein